MNLLIIASLQYVRDFVLYDLLTAFYTTVHVARGVYLTLHSLNTFQLARTHPHVTCTNSSALSLYLSLALTLTLLASLSLFRWAAFCRQISINYALCV